MPILCMRACIAYYAFDLHVHVHVYVCIPTVLFIVHACIHVHMCTCAFPLYSSDDEIRECVFLSLDERFDPHLAQAESLTTLFVAMHDGVSWNSSQLK